MRLRARRRLNPRRINAVATVRSLIARLHPAHDLLGSVLRLRRGQHRAVEPTNPGFRVAYARQRPRMRVMRTPCQEVRWRSIIVEHPFGVSEPMFHDLAQSEPGRHRPELRWGPPVLWRCFAVVLTVGDRCRRQHIIDVGDISTLVGRADVKLASIDFSGSQGPDPQCRKFCAPTIPY